MIIPIKGTKMEQLSCLIENKYEKYTQKIWLRKPHVAKCSICGKELHSMYPTYKIKDEYSPEQCGWVQVRNNKLDRYPKWICHSCYGHHSEHYISKEELERKYISKNVHELVKKLRYQEGLKDGKELPKEVSYQPGDIVLVKSYIEEIELHSDESILYSIKSLEGDYDIIHSDAKDIIRYENDLYHIVYIFKDLSYKDIKLYRAWNENSKWKTNWNDITPKEIICKIGEIDLSSLNKLMKNKE